VAVLITVVPPAELSSPMLKVINVLLADQRVQRRMVPMLLQDAGHTRVVKIPMVQPRVCELDRVLPLMVKRSPAQERPLAVLEIPKGIFVEVLQEVMLQPMETRPSAVLEWLAGNLMSMALVGMRLAVEEWQPTEPIRWCNAGRRLVYETPTVMPVVLLLAVAERPMDITLTVRREPHDM
jgi:hypothetical protein